MNREGLWIVFEGINYSGKGSIIKELKYSKNISETIGPTLVHFEPNEKAKKMLLNNDELSKIFNTSRLSKDEKKLLEYYLMMADRCSSIKVYAESIKRGINILQDRSYISTMIYQNCALKGFTEIYQENYNNYLRILAENNLLKLEPDLFVLVNCDYDTYIKRHEKRKDRPYLREEEFINKIRDYNYIFDNYKIASNKMMISNDEDLSSVVDKIYNKIISLHTTYGCD